jgi:beta-glucosidase
MKYFLSTLLLTFLFLSCTETKKNDLKIMKETSITPFKPAMSFEDALAKADTILKSLTIDEKINLIGGHDFFYSEGVEKYKIPRLYMSDATQGVHIRTELPDQLEKSTAFPSPILMAATWNPSLTQKIAKSVGEECRAGGIAVLLAPGMNIYRISQNGRNFEYFGEDPYLASRNIENYVVGNQNTGTITTLKHFLCNNTEFNRRRTNVIVDERTIREIYTPAFQAGIDAGALAVMTSYNMINGEYAGESKTIITDLLRGDLGFKGLVMSDWWSVWDPVKTMTSGMDLEMPGEQIIDNPDLKAMGDIYVRSNAKRLLKEGKVKEADLNRMSQHVIALSLEMGLDKRTVKDESYLAKFPEHEKVALQTAKEGIVLLKNNNVLPISKNKKVLITGDYMETLARGLGSAEVDGYNVVKMSEAFKAEFGENLTISENPTNEALAKADVVLVSIGTLDSESWDKPFALPKETNDKILNIAAQNKNTVVIVNSGSGIEMTPWNDKVAGIIYSWYVGQNGNTALAEIVSGKTNPSGKLPITIEKQFADSPGANYLPEGTEIYTGWDADMDMKKPLINIDYKEGVLVGYRWYEAKNIKPLYAFGYGLSYTTFDFSNLKLSSKTIHGNQPITVTFTVANTGNVDGAEVAQLYVQDVESSVIRPIKELKGFKKVFLKKGESVQVEMELTPHDLSFYDVNSKNWKAEDGQFNILVGNASDHIILKDSLMYSEK